jgi:EAL domain-containing protein (putative c-di-GMP-specific phosphodiesterase class I)/GGDEF domain-containing protein
MQALTDNVQHGIDVVTDRSADFEGPPPRRGIAAADETVVLALFGPTGRSQLLEQMRGLLSRLRDEYTLIVMALDLDNLAALSVARGGATAEIVMSEVAQRLHEALRDRGGLIWTDGGRFVVVCELNGSPKEIWGFQKEVASCFDDPFIAGHSPVYLAAKVGVAFSMGDRDDPDLLLGSAEVACLEGQKIGQRLVVFDHPARMRIRQQFELSQALHAALANDGLELEYEPVFSVTTRSVVGVTARICWTERGGDRIPEETFRDCAERSGLVIPVGGWMLRQLALDWPAVLATYGGGPLTLHIEVTSEQLGAWLADTPDELPSVCRLLGGHLEMEILDTRLTAGEETATAILEWLDGLDVRLVVDALGSGHATRQSLRTRTAATVKLNRLLIAKVHESTGDRLMVETMVKLARSFDMIVLAQGVVSEEQLTCLAEIGCDQAAGPLLALPHQIDVTLA